MPGERAQNTSIQRKVSQTSVEVVESSLVYTLQEHLEAIIHTDSVTKTINRDRHLLR